MKLLALAAFAAAVAGSAMAQGVPRPLLDKGVEKAYGAWVVEVGVGARIMGECERHYPPGSADTYVASLASVSAGIGDDDFTMRLRELFLRNYAEGRAEAAKSQLNPAACQRLLSEHERLRDRAADDARAALAAYVSRALR